MHSVVFKYRPIHWFPYRRKIKTTHPDSWEDLTPLQFEGVVDFLNNENKKDRDFILLANLLLSLNSPLTSFPPEIFELQKFLQSDKPFSCWIIKAIETESLFLQGPSDDFRNVTIGQFAFADTYFIQYIRDKKPEQLNKLITSLYYLVEWDPDGFLGLENKISLISEKTKTAILFNYMIMRMWIMQKYPYVFPKPPKDNDNKESKKETLKPHSTWREFIRNLINGDYVNEDKILKTLMHTVLYDYNANIKKQINKKK